MNDTDTTPDTDTDTGTDTGTDTDTDTDDGQVTSDQGERQRTSPDTADTTDWKAEAQKWQALARKHEGQAKGQAKAVKTVQEQMDDLRKQMADQATRDLERAGKTATAQLRAVLAEQGIKADDVADLLPDPVRLLKDGEPDDKAITKFAGALAKVAGRPTPDPDQGRRSDDTPTDMNALIRRAAGRA
jgi:hypothetical protein